MVTTNNLREFIKTNDYVSLLNEVIERLNINVSKDEPSSQMFNIHADCVNKSGINLNELNELCYSEKERLVVFTKLKLAEIEDDEDDDNDNDNDNDDKSKTLEILPFPRVFLIGYIIEFYFLKNNPYALADYLKKLRVPSSIKYAKELKSIYSRL
ncbi:hypothetical protein PAH69_000039 [Salmonella enterica]|nr:hypothetical protein [Salmonella enterica]EKH2045374.1 hypothetical protein [Salmonella enterica]EKI9849765.1 hypothetical protein [Salmonella enterica]